MGDNSIVKQRSTCSGVAITGSEGGVVLFSSPVTPYCFLELLLFLFFVDVTLCDVEVEGGNLLCTPQQEPKTAMFLQRIPVFVIALQIGGDVFEDESVTAVSV